jgi:ATP-binding cassette, subfamily B, bacterial
VSRWAVAARAAFALGIRAAPWMLLGTVLVALVAAAVPVAAAWLTKTVIERLTSPGGFEPQIAVLAGALAAVGIVAAVLPYADGLFRSDLARAIGLLAQDRLYRAVNGYAGLVRFEDPAFLDRLQLAQRCGQDAPTEIVGSGIGLVRNALTVVGFLTALLVISPWMVVVVVLGAVPTLIAEIRLARARVGATMRANPLERREYFYADLLGSVAAAKEIRLFGIGDHLRSRMRADRRAINAVNRQFDRRTLLEQGLPALVSACLAAAGLVWAVRASAQGVITVGDVSLFVAGVAGVQTGLTSITAAVAVTHQHLLLFQHFVDVTTAPPDLPVLAPARPVPPLRHRIELRDVWFRYSDQHPWILRGVDLTLVQGRSLALVGVNGAGKSTLVKLLCRYYDPTRGVVLWDGIDIRHFPPAEMRRRVSAIFQDFMRYDLTAAENVSLGNIRHADNPPAIHEAAARAGVHDVLDALPRGYQTMLTRAFAATPGTADDGVVLSGGQWQRVALARAFLRDSPDLLILDEPSAGLDAMAEHEIHTRLRTYRHRQTSLLISHRLGAVRDADLIVVLADGEIAERGSHAQLIAARGLYARLFELQSAGYLPDASPERQPAVAEPS